MVWLWQSIRQPARLHSTAQIRCSVCRCISCCHNRCKTQLVHPITNCRTVRCPTIFPFDVNSSCNKSELARKWQQASETWELRMQFCFNGPQSFLRKSTYIKKRHWWGILKKWKHNVRKGSAQWPVHHWDVIAEALCQVVRPGREEREKEAVVLACYN